MTFNFIHIIADAAAKPPQLSPTENLLSMLMPIIAFVLLFWVLVIRPQKKREETLRAQVEKMKRGDKLVCCGGIVGTIDKIREKTLIVRTADDTLLEIDKSAVNTVESAPAK